MFLENLNIQYGMDQFGNMLAVMSRYSDIAEEMESNYKLSGFKPLSADHTNFL